MSELDDILKDAVDEFPPTLSKGELDGKVFQVTGYRLATTQYGQRHVGLIKLSGAEETVEAWLDGVFLTRQLVKLAEKEAFPCLLKLTKDEEINGSPWMFVTPSEAEKKAWLGDPKVPAANPDAHAEQMPKAVNIAVLYQDAEAVAGGAAYEALEKAELTHVVTIDDSGNVIEGKMTLGERAKAIAILKEVTKSAIPFE